MRYRVSYLMDEIWERAVETALDGQTDRVAARTLTLDGAVKCVQGRLPPPSLLEKFPNLHHLSIANIGVSTLEQFPRLPNLQKLILSDNRIAGGLKFLVEAGLDSLRDLDLSNNRIQFIEDLEPLAQLKLVSLDLYECPVTRTKDYRSRIFGLIKSLKYLDKMDSEENERPESEDEEEEEEEDEEEDDDPGSGEVDGVDQPYRIVNGHNDGVEGVVDVDEDEESDADEEETETSRQVNGTNHQVNGFHAVPVEVEDAGEYEDVDDEEDNESVEEIDEEEGGDDDVAVEIHEIDDSDDEEDGVEYNEDDDEDDDEDEEVDNEEGNFAEPEGTGRLVSTEGEIDGHEQGEDGGDEDDNGETEEEQGIEEDVEYEDEEDGEEEDEDYGSGYLVQPVVQAAEEEEEEEEGGGALDMGPVNEDSDEDEEEEVEDDADEVEVIQPSSSQPSKRKREEEEDSEEEEEEDEDIVEHGKSTKKHR